MSRERHTATRASRWPARLLLSIPLLLIVTLGTYHWWYLLRGSEPLEADVREELRRLGAGCVASRDVPVAAVILYGGKIIGRGRNTVLRDANAAGHAEINAITDAIRRFGKEGFMRLNRDSLELISTLEPCPMCAGAIAEYRIRSVSFLKSAPVDFELSMDYQLARYHFRARRRGDASLQDSLLQQLRIANRSDRNRASSAPPAVGADSAPRH